MAAHAFRAAPNCRPRAAQRCRAPCRRTRTPWASSHSKVGGAVVGEGADDLAVVVAVIAESRWARPPTSRSGPGRTGRANPRCRISSGSWCRRRAEHCRRCVMAWPPMWFCASTRITERAGFARDDGGRQPRRARADHDDIGLAIPMRGRLARRCRSGIGRSTGGRGQSSCRAASHQQISTIHLYGSLLFISGDPAERLTALRILCHWGVDLGS